MKFNTVFMRLVTMTIISSSVGTFSSFAAPGTLSQLPLVPRSTALSNLMILVDTSSSMGAPTKGLPYDDSIDYKAGGACTQIASASTISTITKNASNEYVVTVTTGGAGTVRKLTDFGFTAGKYCFANTGTYGAIVANDIRLPGGNLNAEGNYFNWLYITSVQSQGATVQYNSTAATPYYYLSSATSRLAAAEKALQFLVNKATGINIGIARLLNGGGTIGGVSYNHQGAVILQTPISVDANRAQLLAVSIRPMIGGSPVDGAMVELGRYLIGTNASDLSAIFNMNTPNLVSLGYSGNYAASAVFNRTPQFVTSMTDTSSPLKYWCQKNYLLVISDGQANDKTDYSDQLKYYLNETKRNVYPADAQDDIAKAMYSLNLRPLLKDDNGNTVVHNIVTYGIGYGVSGATGVMYDTAVAGGGRYSDAAEGTDLIKAVDSMTTDIVAKLLSGSGITFNSSSLQADSALYKANFNTGSNIGDLQKVTINVTTGAVNTTPIWSFQALLQAKTPASRFMFTNTGPKTALLFTSTNLTSLSTAQQADLNQGPTAVDNLGVSRINYILGNTVAGFRDRAKILGDIVGSSPIYVGKPISGLYPNDTTYTTFVTNNANRAGMVYIGDNSGVFHAIDAVTGDEKFAYLPLNLFSNAAGKGYHYLTDPGYIHRFYINGPYGIGDAYLNSAWQTVLVSGEGAGGQGYFALNVTNPSSFTSGNQSSIFKWEFSSSHDTDLGYTFSKPIIGKMNDGKWYAIFGNGYNSANGIAKLFLVKLDGPSGTTWAKGTDYYVLTTGNGSTGNPDGLSSPTAIDTNADGMIDRIYAGSAQGTMWSFNVSSATPGSWGNGVALISTGQPIIAAPLVTLHPTVATTAGNQPNTMVFFGTGQYLTPTDPGDMSARGLYGVWDNGSGTALVSQLVTQTLTTSGTTRTVSSNAVDYTTKRGWTIALTGGERSILTPGRGNTTVFFGTMQPLGLSSSPCATDNGLGWIIAVDTATGSAGANQVLDINGDSIVSAADKSNGTIVVGARFTAGYPNEFGFLGDSLYAPLSDASVGKIVIDAGGGSIQPGRISVEELRPPGS